MTFYSLLEYCESAVK